MSGAIEPFRVVIVGGGVAGLEGALALRELAGERVALTLLSPERSFVERPLRVLEPFSAATARHYPLERIATDLGARLLRDSLAWLEPARRVAHTSANRRLSYDALLLAPGARRHPRLRHALTLNDRRLAEQLERVVRDIDIGHAHRLAFVQPGRGGWPLPIYELALLTAGRAAERGTDLSVTVLTPERAPLEVFGPAASARVAALLEQRGILLITAARCETPAPGEVACGAGGRRLRFDRVIALPELLGPAIPGIPQTARGFVPIDQFGGVVGLEGVFAAGDATDFPVRHGAIAAQQADAAAASIAAQAGAPVEAQPLRPVIHAVLLGGERPLCLSARLVGGHAASWKLSESPDCSPGEKLHARYLSPYLRELAAIAERPMVARTPRNGPALAATSP